MALDLVTEEERTQTYRRVVGRILPFLMVCYVLAQVDRTNVAIAKLQFMHDLDFTPAVYGFGLGIFYLGYCTFEIPSNLWLNRIGMRKVILRIMVGWGAVSALFSLMQTEYHFYILRVLLGAAEAGFFPGAIFYISLWVPSNRRARATSYFMAAGKLAGVLGPPLAGFIMTQMNGVGGLAGWKWLFILEGIPAVAAGIFGYFWLSDRPADARWLSERQRQIVTADIDADGPKSTEHGTSFWLGLRDPLVYVFMAMAIPLMSAGAALYLWTPTILHNVGVQDVQTIGILNSLPFIFGLLAQLILARFSDRSGERRKFVAAAGMIGAVGWLCLPLAAHSVALTVVLLIVAAVGISAGMPIFWAMPARYFGGAGRAGIMALITTAGGVFGIISPTVVGLLGSSGSMVPGEIYYGLLTLVGTSIFFLGTRGLDARRGL